MKNFIYFFLLNPIFVEAAPKVFFNTAPSYDQMCARGFDFENFNKTADSKSLKEAWSEELVSRLIEFDVKWAQESPKLFNILNDEFHKDFSRKEYSIALSACASAPSMPFPLVLNVSRFLKSYWDGRPAKSIDLFLDLPFHELLHIWLAENYPNLVLLNGKYRDANSSVRHHVHLFAVQSLVYEKAGFSAVWKNTHDFMLKAGGAHKKAMEILDKEGRDKILKDLK